MNSQAFWLVKHWGLGIGTLMSFGGLILAAPGNMQSWRISEVTEKDSLLGMSYTATAVTRLNESIPNGYKPVDSIHSDHELKGLGSSMMILGTTLLFGCASSLKPEYERLEKANWMVKRSEFDLADLEYTKGVEVDRYAIELDAQQQISNMIQPPKPYYEKQDDQLKLKPEPEFSLNATGFLGWLLKKAGEKSNSTFEVRWCCQQTWGGQKSSRDQIVTWVTELSQIEQAEWLDEEKKTFRLLG